MSALIGYHCSHEQFAPSKLLTLVRTAEDAGFGCAMSSDHFRPWAEVQGHSGYAWSWLGAALQATELPFGVISAPGYRYHPAILAQGAATLAEMFPNRFWLALGSGQRLNEGLSAEYWPEKSERNARLAECAMVIRALLNGETVTHRGRVTVIDGKLYSRPQSPPALLGAAVTEATARQVGEWADGLLTVSAPPEQLCKVVDAFRSTAGDGKRLVVQVGLSWAETDEEALHLAHDQWRFNTLGGEVNWELRLPSDFETASRLVRPEDMRESVLISSDLGQHAEWLQSYKELGFTEIQLHQVGLNQEPFLEAFGRSVLPQLR
jgi:coenzyme F420-dependent glucose-6-phosphate dehydrogenase